MTRVHPLLFATLAALAFSCAEVPPPRSTIQVDAIAKTDLEGVWYFRQTVVGVPFTTGFTFIGEQGENEMEKIRWDIQEDLLTARRSYEYVKGSEKGEPAQGGAAGTYLGAPVAAFKIKSQFDIIREYNPSTGEEIDRLIESTERKWYDRKFIRVDWSTNLVTNFQFLADYSSAAVGSIKQDPAPYYVSDPRDADALKLERPAKDQPANYLEVTQKIIASPEAVDFVDWANVPLCWLEYATQDCASQEIKIRNSFMRVNPANDYEPMAYTDLQMEKFGYFTVERKSYNRQYGLTETGRIRLISRHNIWQHGLSAQTCRVDADCGAYQPGVRCATEIPDAPVNADGSLSGRCALPFSARNLEDPTNPDSQDLGPRKIVYYLNDSFPADLKEAATQLGNEYDGIYRDIYKSAVGRDAPGTMFVVCLNNPVQDGDPAECGPTGTHARLGDIRFNMLNWVDEPTSAQLLGYGPSSNDPETGQIISAVANVYGAEVDSYAAYARDVVKLVNGDIPPDRFIAGVNVQEWVASHAAGPRARTQEEVEAAGAAMDLSWTKALPKTPSMKKGSARALKEMARARSAALSNSQALGAEAGLTANRLAKLKGTGLERQLAGPEILLAHGMDPNTASSAIDLGKVSPLSMVNPERARIVQRERRRISAHGVDMAAGFDDAVVGLALQQKGTDSQDLWRKLRSEVFRSTALHEVGHTVGLRHNFAGSYDPMNYPKTYWDLRLADGPPRPRYLDPENDVERQGVVGANGLKSGISGFMQSSIMDYGAKFNSDINGMGRYDRAAMKYGYANLLEVFNNTSNKYLLGALQATVTFGEAQPLLIDCSGNNWISAHYTKLPSMTDLNNRSDIDAKLVTNSEVSTECAYPDSVDHSPDNRLVVPYKFCSDEFEGVGVGCAAFDRGADVYEVAHNNIEEYRNYYIFNNFKRDRLGFNADEYLDRIYSRYLDSLRDQMQFYALYRADYEGSDVPAAFWTSPDGWGPYTLAVSEGFDLLGEMLTMPEPGPYYLYNQDDGRDAYQMDQYGTGAPDFTIEIPNGRTFSTEWDYSSGYYWYERVSSIGSFLDKVAVLAQMTDPQTYFLGRDTASDVRQYAINYWRLYPKQMTEVFAAALTDRWDRLAPVWTGTQYQVRPISQPITIPTAPAYPVDPLIGFTVQLWASSLGMALIPATYDQTYANSSRMFLLGNGEAYSTTVPTVTYTDVASGKTYVAASYKQGVIETGVAARMIARANELEALATGSPPDPYAAANLAKYVQMLEVMRSLSGVYADPLF
jgi:hypothetical protein